MKIQKKEIQYSLISAGITAVLVTVAFWCSGRFPGREHIFLNGDYYQQYMQFIRAFFDKLLHGETLAYSFEMSMGMPSWASYAYESLSPFNLWFLFISDVDTAAFLTVLNKLMACGGLFCFCLCYVLRVRPEIGISLGCIYALCGYNVSYYYNVQYLDGVYLLPLLMLLLFRFVRTGKTTALTMVYAYSFIVLFYSGYMLGVFSGLVWIALMWYVYGKDKDRYIRCMPRFVFCVLTAVLLSAAVTVPTAWFLKNHNPEDATKFSGLSVSLTGFLQQFFPGHALGVTGKVPAVYSGVLTLLAVAVFFANKQTDRRKKIVALIVLGLLLLCTFFAPLYLLIHGFDAPDMSDFRFSYMYSFVLLFIAAQALQEAGTKEKGWLYAAGAYSGVSILCFVTQKEQGNPLTLELALVFLGAFAFVIYRVNAGRTRMLILSVLIGAELLLNAFFGLTPDNTDLARMGTYYRHWQDEGQRAMEMIAVMDAEENGMAQDFYRVCYENVQSQNEPLFYHYPGIGYFSTLEQPALRQALFRLGYSTATRLVSDYGSTPLTQMIFAQRYRVHATDPRIEAADAFCVSRNAMVLPLAYMVSEQIEALHLTEDNALQNQNMLISAMTGKERKVLADYCGNVEMTSDGLQLSTQDGVWRVSALQESGGSLSLFPETRPDRQMYAYFSQDASVNAFHTAKIGTNADIGLPMMTSYLSMPHILPVPQEDGEIRILISSQDEKIATFREMYFAELNPEALEEVYRELIPGAAREMAFSEDHISFNVTVAEDKTVLFTSIPFDTGWMAMVDGTEAPTEGVLDGAFLAVELPAGEHRIELQYRDKSITAGILGSVVGGLVLMGSILVSKRKKEQKQE
ncbi:MAG: YfhO family protein [Lachnospiraceae bacterium]|nr:YfhO family protein [Lachnospiraceae bacterium]